MMKGLILLVAFFHCFSQPLMSQGIPKVYVKRYVTQIFSKPNRESQVLTNVLCSTAMSVDFKENKQSDEKSKTSPFLKVRLGEIEGYAISEHLSQSKRADCFQEKYIEFYKNISSYSLLELYHLGRIESLIEEHSVRP